MNGSTAVRQTKAFLKNKPPSVSMEIEFNVSLQLITLNLLQTNSTVSKKYSKCTGTYTHITHVGRYTHKAYIYIHYIFIYKYYMYKIYFWTLSTNILYTYTSYIWSIYLILTLSCMLSAWNFIVFFWNWKCGFPYTNLLDQENKS